MENNLINEEFSMGLCIKNSKGFIIEFGFLLTFEFPFLLVTSLLNSFNGRITDTVL